MLGLVLGIIGSVAAVVLFVVLYVWTRRSERDIEIPKRELTDREQEIGLLERGYVNNIFTGGW